MQTPEATPGTGEPHEVSAPLARGGPAEGSVPLARSLPKASYTDEAEFRRERDTVLFAEWFCVGRADGLANPGDYLTADVAGESVIVVRGDDDELRGFYNLCRHRGSRLVPPEESEPASSSPGCFDGVIRCPYHAWTYGLDGGLRSAPFLPDLRHYRAALALHGVDVGTWGGFAFVRLERGPAGRAPAGRGPAGRGPAWRGPAGQTLMEALGQIPARLARYPLADLRSGARISYQVAANWKVILENYNECYHCGPVHPELCELVPDFARGGADLDWDSGVPHRGGAYTFTTTGTTLRAPFPGLSEQERTRHKGELVLPNLMISLSADHVAAFTVWPHAAGRTTVVCDFLFQAGEIARPDFDPSDAVAFWDLVNRQDWRICERVQDGMSSRRFDVGYLAPMEEPSADVGRYVAARTRQAAGH